MKHNFFQTTVFLIFVISLFLIIFPLFEYQTYSPDSIRFLHFWQNSFSSSYADIEASSFNLNVFFSNIYDAFRASNYYDLGRGRIVTYIIYGIENILLYSFNALPTNFLILAIVIINSHGASKLISRDIIKFRFYIFIT